MLNICIETYTWEDMDPKYFYKTYFSYNVVYGSEHYRIRQKYNTMFEELLGKYHHHYMDMATLYALPDETIQCISILIVQDHNTNYRAGLSKPMVKVI